jgi:histidine triad (HIT) family protein
MPDYDPDNIFAKIISGKIPCHKVYEDGETIAFMDIMPQGEGHTLVVPKGPARNLFDASAPTLTAAIGTTQVIARAVMKAFAADGVTVMQFNEPAAGQSVFHLHFHVIPRFEGVALRPHSGTMADPEKLKEHAKRISAALVLEG